MWRGPGTNLTFPSFLWRDSLFFVSCWTWRVWPWPRLWTWRWKRERETQRCGANVARCFSTRPALAAAAAAVVVFVVARVHKRNRVKRVGGGNGEGFRPRSVATAQHSWLPLDGSIFHMKNKNNNNNGKRIWKEKRDSFLLIRLISFFIFLIQWIFIKRAGRGLFRISPNSSRRHQRCRTFLPNGPLLDKWKANSLNN